MSWRGYHVNEQATLRLVPLKSSPVVNIILQDSVMDRLPQELLRFIVEDARLRES